MYPLLRMVYLNLQNVDFLLKVSACILSSVTRIMVKTYNCSCNRNMYNKYIPRAACKESSVWWPRLVGFAIGLVNSVLNLPDRQVKYFEELNLQKNCEINSAHQKILGASRNDVWASKFSLLELDNTRFISFCPHFFYLFQLPVTCTFYVQLPPAPTALPFQTCMPRALAFCAHHIRLLCELVTINAR